MYIAIQWLVLNYIKKIVFFLIIQNNVAPVWREFALLVTKIILQI